MLYFLMSVVHVVLYCVKGYWEEYKMQKRVSGGLNEKDYRKSLQPHLQCLTLMYLISLVPFHLFCLFSPLSLFFLFLYDTVRQ